VLNASGVITSRSPKERGRCKQVKEGMKGNLQSRREHRIRKEPPKAKVVTSGGPGGGRRGGGTNSRGGRSSQAPRFPLKQRIEVVVVQRKWVDSSNCVAEKTVWGLGDSSE